MALRRWQWARGGALAVIAIGLLACQNRSSSTNQDSGPRGDGGATQAASLESKQGRASKAVENSGKAVFPVKEHDFGDVEEGESVTHVFAVRNEGEDTLHIKRVRGS